MVHQIRFYLDLPTEKYLRYYQGAASSVSVISVDGRRLEFPAAHLRHFVSRDGVQGEFVLKFDADNKFIGLERIGDLPARG